MQKNRKIISNFTDNFLNYKNLLLILIKKATVPYSRDFNSYFSAQM